MQGDQYDLVFSGTKDGEALDMNEIEEIEFTVGAMRKCFPEEVRQDTDGNFLFPLTQAETFAIRAGPMHVQVRVKFYGSGDTIVVGQDVGNLRVTDSMSKVVL